VLSARFQQYCVCFFLFEQGFGEQKKTNLYFFSPQKTKEVNMKKQLSADWIRKNQTDRCLRLWREDEYGHTIVRDEHFDFMEDATDMQSYILRKTGVRWEIDVLACRDPKEHADNLITSADINCLD